MTPKPIIAALTLSISMLSSGWTTSQAQDKNVEQKSAEQKLDGAGDPMPPGAIARMGSVRFCSPDGVMEFFLSADEKTLVSFGRLVIGWDVETGKELWRKPSPIGYLPAAYGMRPITEMPDGEHFLMAGPGDTLTRWQARTGESDTTKIPFRHIGGRAGIGGGGRAIEVSANGKFFFVGTSIGFTVFDENGKDLYSIAQIPGRMDFNGRDRLKFGGAYSYGRFSPDGKTLAVTTSGASKEIKLYNAADGKELGKLTCHANVVRMAFSPDSKHLAASERDTAIRFYEVGTQKKVWEHVFDVDKRSENYSSAIAFTPDGSKLAVCERNETIFVMDTDNGKELGAIRDHSWNPWAVVFAKDNDTLYSSGWGGTIHQWSVNSFKALPLPVGRRGTSVAAISPDGQKYASVDQGGVIHVNAIDDNSELQTLKINGGSFEVLEFSRDGTRLAGGGSWNGNVHIVIWTLDDGAIWKQWQWDIGKDPVTGVEEIRFSQNDDKLAVAVFRQDASYLIDFKTNERKKLRQTEVYGLSFTVDDQQLITAGWDKKLKRWNTTNGELISSQEMPKINANEDTRMYTVDCDPLGSQLATALLGAEVRLWSEKDLSLVREWKIGGSFTFGALRYSPDGLWLATGTSGGKIEIWDPSDGSRLHEIPAHEDHVYVVGFGKDNRTLCSGGANVGYLWNLRPANLAIESTTVAIDRLLHKSGKPAYDAWWYLVDQGDTAVEEILAEVLKTKQVLDIDAQVANSTPDQRERREKLLRQVVEKSPTTIDKAAVRRVVSVLSHIDTPKAVDALKQIAENNDDLGRHADWELKRRKP